MKIAIYLTPEQARALAQRPATSTPAMLEASLAAQRALVRLETRIRDAENLLARYRDSERD